MLVSQREVPQSLCHSYYYDDDDDDDGDDDDDYYYYYPLLSGESILVRLSLPTKINTIGLPFSFCFHTTGSFISQLKQVSLSGWS